MPSKRNATTVPPASAGGRTTDGTAAAPSPLAGTGPVPVSALASALADSESQLVATKSQVLPGTIPGQELPPAQTEVTPVIEPAPPGAEAGTEPNAGEEAGGQLTEEHQEQEQEQEQEQQTAGVKKRIGRLQATVRELQQKLARAEAVPGAPGGGTGALSGVMDPGQLDSHQERAEAGLEEVETLMTKLAVAPARVEQYLRANGIVLKDEQDQEDYSAERVSDFLSSARGQFRQLLKAVPRRRAYLKEYEQAHAQVVAVMPWINDLGDERQALLENIAAQFPQIKSQPNWEYWVGCAIEGERMVKARQRANGSPGTARTGQAGAGRGSAAGSAGAGAARLQPRGDEAKIAGAKQQVFKEGSRRALSAFFDAVGVHR